MLPVNLIQDDDPNPLRTEVQLQALLRELSCPRYAANQQVPEPAALTRTVVLRLRENDSRTEWLLAVLERDASEFQLWDGGIRIVATVPESLATTLLRSFSE